MSGKKAKGAKLKRDRTNRRNPRGNKRGSKRPRVRGKNKVQSILEERGIL